MCKEYIIEIGQDEGFPFDGHKKHCDQVLIRKKLSFDNSEEKKFLLKKIRLLLALSSPYLVRILRVIQRKRGYILVDYEYVPDNLAANDRVMEQSFLTSVKHKLEQVCLLLTQSCIKMELTVQNVGITSDGELKVFVNHHFEILQDQQKLNLGKEYHNQLEKLMEAYFNFSRSLIQPSQLSDYSARLDRKITAIEDIINRRKGKISRTSSHRSAKSSKDYISDPKRSNYVLQSMNSKHQTKTSQTSAKTTQSYISSEQTPQQARDAHNSSFHECNTSSYKLNQSGNREDSLTKRLFMALEKSKKTFKIYEKYFARKNNI